MEFISKNKISKDLLKSYNEEMYLGLVKSLEKEKYISPFDGLKILLYLRELLSKRPDLKSDYIHLLDQEPFNAN